MFTGHTPISVLVLFDHICILTGYGFEYEVYKQTNMPEAVNSGGEKVAFVITTINDS